ncbi:MAG: putative cobaltochelatase [Candidatus Altarchaeum sp.]|nr:putative cobaltochelatase [Candidatus Altarchaeum sp.]
MTHHMERTVLPFTAIVGQEKLKKALILNAINPNLHGVLIKGEKGTAKSTAVRALADLLPEIEIVKCPFNCSPEDIFLQCDDCNKKYANAEKLETEKRKIKVVELPLGATEDRVIGTIDIEKALKDGIKALQPGVLAEVNQGILYIDEVNLLDDHLVDILLDSAAMSVNVIEREGVSISHPSKFILVGTMNPEEGELRQQLLDRFGLQVDVVGVKDVDERVRIIKTVEEFRYNPYEFIEKYKTKQDELKIKILDARKLLKNIEISDKLLKKIAKLCIELGVDGHRADILIASTAKTIAAYNMKNKVDEKDIKEAADLVLPHRMRKQPFQELEPIENKIDEIMNDDNDENNDDEQQDDEQEQEEKEDQEEKEEQNDDEQEPQPQPPQPKNNDNKIGKQKKNYEIGNSQNPEIKINKDKRLRIGSGKRAKTLSSKYGKYIKSKIPKETASDIAIDATIRASVVRNVGKGNIKIEKDDLREKVREKKKASVIVFVVDSSGSMATKKRMEAAKGAVMALLEDAYQKRDKVGFVAFRGNKAEILLKPTPSVELATRYLKELPTGGRTPLPDGMYKGFELLKREINKDKNTIPVMILISDGKGNVPIQKNVRKEIISLANEIKENNIHLMVINSGQGFVKLGYNSEIVEASCGEYINLDKLSTDNILGAVKSNLIKI